MHIGYKIKWYRENLNLSQDELANKVYVSRQTISNWENDRYYPDINSLKILSDIFNVPLDEFIKDDIKKMKRIINLEDLKIYDRLSNIYCILFFVLLVFAYPLFVFLELTGIIIYVLIAVVTLCIGIRIEKIYEKHDCRTYKEIVAFTEGKTLSTKEQIEEKAKRPYQKFLLGLLSGVIAFIVFIILELVFGK